MGQLGFLLPWICPNYRTHVHYHVGIPTAFVASFILPLLEWEDAIVTSCLNH